MYIQTNKNNTTTVCVNKKRTSKQTIITQKQYVFDINTRYHRVDYDVKFVKDILILNNNNIINVSMEKGNATKSVFPHNNTFSKSNRLSNLRYINCNNYKSHINLVFINNDIRNLNVYSLCTINFIFIDTFVNNIKYFDKNLINKKCIQKKEFENLPYNSNKIKNITIVNTKSKKIVKKENFKLSEISFLIKEYSSRQAVC